MRITFSLSDSQYLANDRSGIMVGLPLTVQLDAGVLALGEEGSPLWCQRTTPGRPMLKPFSLERCAFHGRITQMEIWRSSRDVVCQVLLDCGVAVRLDLWDPELSAGQSGTPYGLQQGDWLMGQALLQGLLAFSHGDLLWEPVTGTIVDIQRLYMEPLNPAFGTLHWFHGLPGQSFAPDQVFATIEV